MQQLAETIHVIVWGPWTMMIFLATGIWFTVKSGGFQFLAFHSGGEKPLGVSGRRNRYKATGRMKGWRTPALRRFRRPVRGWQRLLGQAIL